LPRRLRTHRPVIPHFDRPRGWKQFAQSVRLKADNRLQQKWMPDRRHAFERRRGSPAVGARLLQFQTKKLDSARSRIQPFAPGILVILDAGKQIRCDPGQFTVFDLIRNIAEIVGVVGGGFVENRIEIDDNRATRLLYFLDPIFERNP
jgi:hypothetical protein